MAKTDINSKRGEELNQLSRFIFDSAATKWYLAALLELVAVIGSLLLGFAQPQISTLTVFGVFAVLVLLVVAYVLRQKFETQYDMAETMRRQSVLTEGLGMPIKESLFSEWRMRTSKRIRSRFKAETRNEDYYRSKKKPSPRRLLEMTIESAFWTRYLYNELRKIVNMVCLVFGLITAATVVFLLTANVSTGVFQTLVYIVFVSVPVFITTDAIGISIRLKRLIDSLCGLEANMEELLKGGRIEESTALRLIFEYNCQVVGGVPIPSQLFKAHYKEIQNEWDATYKSLI